MLKGSGSVMNAQGEACPTAPTQRAVGGRKHSQCCFLIMSLCGGERMYHFRFDCKMPLLLVVTVSVIQLVHPTQAPSLQRWPCFSLQPVGSPSSFDSEEAVFNGMCGS